MISHVRMFVTESSGPVICVIAVLAGIAFGYLVLKLVARLCDGKSK